jgi:hypothetical protein
MFTRKLLRNSSRLQNLLTFSEQFDDAAWVKFLGISVTPDITQNPVDDAITADTINASASNSHIVQNRNVTPSTTYTFSIWLRSVSDTFNLKLSRTNGVTWATASLSPVLTLTTTWQRFSLTYTSGVGETISGHIIGWEGRTPYLIPTTGSFYAWGAQLNEGETAYDYVQTGATAIL